MTISQIPYPTQARVQELLCYDISTGILTWRITRGRARAGHRAGYFDEARNARTLRIDRIIYTEHIIAYLYVTGIWAGDKLRHINGIRDDNRFENLYLNVAENPDELTRERLMRIISYDALAGTFIWLVSPASNTPRHSEAGAISKTGYRYINIDGKSRKASRLAWLYMMGAWPSHHIDHINGDSADDRFCNLREATNTQNSRNRMADSKNNSGHVGVRLRKNGTWRAYIRFDGKQIHLGTFANKAAAIAARRAAELEHFGEFAPRHETAQSG